MYGFTLVELLIAMTLTAVIGMVLFFGWLTLWRSPDDAPEARAGDLLVQLGRTDEAYAAYQKAKAALSDEAAVGGLQIKLDDLAKGDA